MASEIRCKDDAGNGCGKLLAKHSGATLTILCPRCGKPQKVSIIDLIEELSQYLQSVKETVEKEASGKGFML